METEHLVAWWPFLILSIIFYGLLPRVLLSISSHVAERRALNRLALNHGDCDRLLRRMTTPQLTFKSEETEDAKKTSPTPSSNTSPTKSLSGKAALLLPSDIAREVDEAATKGFIANKLNLSIDQVVGLEGNLDSDQQRLAFLTGNNAQRVLILQEAWLPPITEFIDFIRTLRHLLSDTVPIHVILIGKPDRETIFTPVEPINFQIWTQALHQLKDPYLLCDCLEGVRDD